MSDAPTFNRDAVIEAALKRRLRHLWLGLFVTGPRLQWHWLHRHEGGWCK